MNVWLIALIVICSLIIAAFFVIVVLFLRTVFKVADQEEKEFQEIISNNH